MGKLVRYFFLLSIILLALTGLLLFRESRPEWKRYQETYQKILSGRAGTAAEQEQASRFTIGVKQDWLPDLDRADRCRSCHVGVDNPDAPQQEPFTPHPEITPHGFEKFGCTVCHDGQGAATRLPDSHEKLLPITVIESSCGKCHGLDGPGLEAAPTYTAGRSLVQEKVCAGCHLLTGENREIYHGPNLVGIDSKVNREWLANWLRNPKDYLPKSRMANFLLNKNEIEALTDFILSQKMNEDESAAFYQGRESEQEILNTLSEDERDDHVDKGKAVFGQLRCLSCHTLHGKGGSIGPDLSRIARKTNRSWLSGWLRSPATYNSKTRMPAFNMITMDRLSLIEYLLWESEEEDQASEGNNTEVSAVSDEAEVSAQPVSGRDVFLAKGCFNCHQLPGIKGNTDFAPPLKGLADKKISLIDFGKTEIPRTLWDYIVVKLQSPRVYGAKLKMPYFGLSPVEAGRLATVLLGRSEMIPSSMQFQKQSPEIPLPAGEVGAIFERYKCLECHKLAGHGGDLAPDLAFEGSKVQSEWLKGYLKKPYAIRPYLTVRMPRFNMSDKEAETLAQYVALVLRNNEIDAVKTAETGNPETGRELYFEKYVCQACHSIDGQGGYYGPALENTANRLKNVWIDRRLVDAHPFEPEAREPALAIPDKNRVHITAFLSTLEKEAEP